MKNFIENKVLDNTDFALNKVGPFAYLVHKMSKPGKFLMEIYDKDRMVHRSEIDCSKEYASTSENIDFSAIQSVSGLQNKFRLNQENGYLLFYNSKEFVSMKVVIRNEKEIEFDSTKPQKGDFYGLNLLKPGVYEMKSKSFKTPIKIDVEYPNLTMNRRTQDMETLLITAETKTNLVSQPNRGLVFQLDEKINDFTVRLLTENKPKPGFSIEDQLKAELSKTRASLKKHSKKEPIRKFSKKYS